MNSGIHSLRDTRLIEQKIDHSLPPSLRLIHFIADDSLTLKPAVLELARATHNDSQVNSMLVLDKAFSTAKTSQGHCNQEEDTTCIQLESWSTIGRAIELYRLCRDYRPDAVFIHSKKHNTWCRQACLRAGNVQVVHINEALRQQIPYGITLDHFNKADEVPLGLRIPGIIMPTGFKDQFYLQLIRAMACLREKHLYPRVFLTGPGTRQAQEAARQLSYALGLDNQLRITSHCGNLPFLLMHHQIAVVGNPDNNPMLVAQSMAAGCVTLGISGNHSSSIIRHDTDGVLFSGRTPELLAEKLEELLKKSNYAQQLARNARLRALEDFSLNRMQIAYQQIYNKLTAGFISTNPAA